ncbi:MAG: sugar ABC transporter permease [Clostridiaceae bacterium]|nr:sugar ABC transporter permease [Clostridiaceae bacterium]
MRIVRSLEGSEISYGNRNLARTIWRNRYVYLLLIPGLLHIFIFSYIPMYGVLLAFKDFSITRGILASPWAGLKHFERALGFGKFWQVFFNTLKISFGKIAIGFWVPIVLALLLNELKNRLFKRVVQTIIYLPHFISWVIVYGMVVSIFSAEGGVINKLITYFGGEPVNFLIEPGAFMGIIYGSEVWKGAGWGTIIYLAALSGIDQELIDAAIVDGANRFQRVIHINIPSIMHTVIILFILRIGGIMNAGFDQIFNFMNPVVSRYVDIIDTYVYQLGLVQSNYSFAAAVGLFKSVLACALLLLVNFLSKKFTESSIF